MTSCGGGGAPGEAPAPGDADADPQLVVAEDTNPAPDVVEVSLRATPATLELRPGARTEVWTYDGRIPGPVLHAKVGDRLVVHFRNDLPAPTTIHWHGIRVPNAMDGTEETQPPVPPGGTFDYEFRLPDAGTYWYHPHAESETQLERGLFGAIVVDDIADPVPLAPTTLVLSDLWLDDAGALVPPDGGGPLVDYFGREGNLLLVNGRSFPTLHVPAGATQRWKLVNAASSRYFTLELAGHAFVKIGSGDGLLEAPERFERLVLPPGERADVLVTPTGQPGDVLTVRWVAYDHGLNSDLEPEQDLFRIALVAGEARLVEAPERLRTIAPVDLDGAREQRIEITGGVSDGVPQLGFDGRLWPDGLMLDAKARQTEVWTIANETPLSHPFHLHGFQFQVLDANTGLPLREWRDTIDVPHDAALRIAIPFDDRTGSWMFHCHILSHVKLGMMGMVMLRD